jgi:hypothetical protein
MIFARTLLLCLALLSCGCRRAQAPDWVASAPAAAVMAVSFRTDWALEQPRLRTLLEPFPLAGRSLDLVLTRVRMNTAQEGGRLTVYLAQPGFLIQLGGFRDPGGLQVAIADAFPVDGQAADNPNRPLFVVLDLPPSHIRAMADKNGRVWLGDPAALAGLGSGRLRARGSLAACADWINGSAAIQGFICPSELLADHTVGLPGDLARDLPRGIEALAWGLTPGSGQDPTNGFELALAGSPEAIQRAAPWLQRFVAAATAMQGPAASTPEILQESRRIGLRCQLSQEQVDVAMAKLDQPPMPCH